MSRSSTPSESQRGLTARSFASNGSAEVENDHAVEEVTEVRPFEEALDTSGASEAVRSASSAVVDREDAADAAHDMEVVDVEHEVHEPNGVPSHASRPSSSSSSSSSSTSSASKPPEVPAFRVPSWNTAGSSQNMLAMAVRDDEDVDAHPTLAMGGPRALPTGASSQRLLSSERNQREQNSARSSAAPSALSSAVASSSASDSGAAESPSSPSDAVAITVPVAEHHHHVEAQEDDSDDDLYGAGETQPLLPATSSSSKSSVVGRKRLDIDKLLEGADTDVSHDEVVVEFPVLSVPDDLASEVDDLLDTDPRAQLQPLLSSFDRQRQTVRDELDGATRGRIQPYADKALPEIESVLRSRQVMIGSVSMEEAEEQERQIQMERIVEAEKNAELEREMFREQVDEEQKARSRLLALESQLEKESRQMDAERRFKEFELQERFQNEFQKEEHDLLNEVREHAGKPKTTVKEADVGDKSGGLDQFRMLQGRQWRVEWEETPVPVRIRIVSLRGVKEKLPAGRYVMMVSLYDRLGNTPQKFRKLEDRRWRGATKPFRHEGRFYDTEMRFEQNLYIAFPPPIAIAPSTVLIFELFLLKGKAQTMDKVVSWASFPAVNGRFQPISGRFKCGMIRGSMTKRVDTHAKIERIFRSDLNNWSGNLYFEVEHLNRYTSQQRECEVELNILNWQIDDEQGEEFRRKMRRKQEIVASDVARKTVARRHETMGERASDLQRLSGVGEVRGHRLATVTMTKGVEDGIGDDDSSVGTPRSPRTMPRTPTPRAGRSGSLLDGPGSASPLRNASGRDAFQAALRSPLVRAQRTASTSSLPTTVRTANSGRGEGRQPDSSVLSPRSGAAVRNMIADLRKLNSRPASLALYRQSVAAPQKVWTEREILQEKFRYLKRGVLTDLGLVSVYRVTFWLSLLLGFMMFWFRYLPHFFGQWLYLEALRIPRTREEWSFYIAFFEYAGQNYDPVYEVLSMAVGTIFVLAVFAFALIYSAVSIRYVGVMNIWVSRGIWYFGLAATLDPVLTFLVDTMAGNTDNGDGYRMFRYYEVNEKNGVFGVFLTLLVDIQLVFIGIVLLYQYTLKYHNNGRLLDVYYRITAPESRLFIPHDFEMSKGQLEQVLERAKEWRGEDGARRNVIHITYKQRERSWFLHRLHLLLSCPAEEWPVGYISDVSLDGTELSDEIKAWARQRVPGFADLDSAGRLTDLDVRKTLVGFFSQPEHYPGRRVRPPAAWIDAAEVDVLVQRVRDEDPLAAEVVGRDLFEVRDIRMLAMCVLFEVDRDRYRVPELRSLMDEYRIDQMIPLMPADIRRQRELQFLRSPKERLAAIQLCRSSQDDNFVRADHVVVFTMALDGNAEMYRQFIRGPDGTICEVFGKGSPAAHNIMDRGIMKASGASGTDAVVKMLSDQDVYDINYWIRFAWGRTLVQNLEEKYQEFADTADTAKGSRKNAEKEDARLRREMQKFSRLWDPIAAKKWAAKFIVKGKKIDPRLVVDDTEVDVERDGGARSSSIAAALRRRASASVQEQRRAQLRAEVSELLGSDDSDEEVDTYEAENEQSMLLKAGGRERAESTTMAERERERERERQGERDSVEGGTGVFRLFGNRSDRASTLTPLP